MKFHIGKDENGTPLAYTFCHTCEDRVGFPLADSFSFPGAKGILKGAANAGFEMEIPGTYVCGDCVPLLPLDLERIE